MENNVNMGRIRNKVKYTCSFCLSKKKLWRLTPEKSIRIISAWYVCENCITEIALLAKVDFEFGEAKQKDLPEMPDSMLKGMLDDLPF